jgi:hypothetical protein
MPSSGPDHDRAWLQVGPAALKHCVASGCIPKATLLLEADRGRTFFVISGVSCRRPPRRHDVRPVRQPPRRRDPTRHNQRTRLPRWARSSAFSEVHIT